MSNLLKKIVDAVDVREFYSEYFEKVGGKSNLPCPFPDNHKKGEDKLPSFRVFMDTGGTFCHGCGYKSSNVVGFWADMNGVDFQRGLEEMYSKYVEKVIPTNVFREPADKLQSNNLVLNKLLKSRGITKETAKKFKLGYDGKRLTIPIFNTDGLCVNIRRYDLFKSGGPKMVSYAEGYGKARMFPLESFISKTVFIVEGELDAILGIQEGINCVSPSGGATAWKDEWGRLFKGKDVIIIPDNDEPGEKGAELRLKGVTLHAKSSKIVKLPLKEPGEDLTDWLMSYGGSAAELKKLSDVVPVQALETPGGDILDGLDMGGKTKSEIQLVARAEAIWANLTNGGAFFNNAEGQLFYAREGMEAMLVSKEFGPFMSFLATKTTMMNQAMSAGRFVYNFIMYKAHNFGTLSKTGNWSMYEKDHLYIHAGKDKILKLGAGKPVYIKNAINDERILLDLPVKNMIISDLPASSPVEGLKDLQELFMRNLAMQEEDRYMIICWLFSIFFRDYVKPKPIVRFLAKTASGKSTSSKLISILLYGEEMLSHSASTVAATYELGSRYPLVLMDNLETRNMTPELEDFLLVAATGGMKAKRQMSTDRGLILEYTNSLILTNGIEPFSRHELIDRTMEVDLDLEKYGDSAYQEARIFAKLKSVRGEIMSAVLFLMHRYVMPRIRKGEINRIMKEFGSHGKERFNEYLAVMCIVLDAFWGYMPLKTYARPHDLVNFWLDSQTRAEQRQDAGTNEALYFLSTFVDRHEQLLGAQVKVNKTEEEIVFSCTSRELLSDFRVLAKSLGMRCPWQNESHLGTRLSDSEEVLNRAGWFRRKYSKQGRVFCEYKWILNKEAKNGRGAKK